MTGVETEIPASSRDAATAPVPVRPWPLAYGEVRVGPWQIAIGCESLSAVSPARRRLFLQAAAVAGIHPDHVLVVRIDHEGVDVDTIDYDDPGWPVRTVRVTPAQLGRLAAGLDG